MLYLCETTINVPEKNEANGCSGGHHAVLLVLEQPLLAILHQKLVLLTKKILIIKVCYFIKMTLKLK